jgi:NAD(P)H dehydrogenase (quinone)
MEILVVFNSKSGNTYALAKAIGEGIHEVEGMEPRIRRVKETTPIDVIRAEKEWSDFYDFVTREVQEVTLDDLVETEGLVMGSPTRYGNIAPAVGNFLECTGPLWAKGLLVNKVGGVFTSTTTMHGGQESTLLSMMIPLMHLGYIIVTMGYTDIGVQRTTAGGTPYGPSSVSGIDAPKKPTDEELSIARAFGKRVAEITKKLRSNA